MLLLLSIPVLSGCGAIQKASNAPLVDLLAKPLPRPKAHVPRKIPKAAEETTTAEAKDKEPHFVEVIEPPSDADGWLPRAQRKFAQVAKEIKKDLDFHETEGLESFGPGALEQVNALRGDMNGSAGIKR